MEGQELLIYFTPTEVFITPYRRLFHNAVELRDVEADIKKYVKWKVKVRQYLPEHRIMSVDVIDPDSREQFPYHQTRILDTLRQIDTICFGEIDTNSLPAPKYLHTSSSRKSSGLLKELHDELHPKPRPVEVPYPVVVSYSDTFHVPLKKVNFKDGHVSCSVKFKQMHYPVEATVFNEDVREVYDAVKGYFINVLQKKSISVTVEVSLTDGVVTSVKALSPEIDGINENLVERVRHEFIKGAKRKAPCPEDKGLLTMEELVATASDRRIQARDFYSKEEELFEDLLQISASKHYRHLRYLSRRHAHKVMKLRFVHKPLSFVFLISGEQRYHIIWETLDTSEATYLWHVEKKVSSLKQTVDDISDIIRRMRNDGKREYLSLGEERFHRIYHDYAAREGGFLKWKDELEAMLT